MNDLVCGVDGCECDVFRRCVDDADLLILACADCGAEHMAGIQAAAPC